MQLLRRLWPLLASNLLLLATCVVCMMALSALRGFVGGESLWSKAQKDAVAHLRLYARTGDPEQFERYRQALAVPLGDRQARTELQKPRPDYALVYAGLRAGKIHPDDIPGMVRLFRAGGKFSYMRRAIAIWTEGDALIEQLNTRATRLKALIATHPSDVGARAELVDQIDRLDNTLGPLEEEFSESLGAASRATTQILIGSAIAASALFLTIAVMLTRSMLVRADLMEQALLHQATHDALTGLVNRREFERRLALALQATAVEGSQAALLYLDLDQFKIVNDTCGHHAGDQLIRRVAETIRGAVRSDDVLGRLGGDEFGLLLVACNPAAALAIAEQIRTLIGDVRFGWEGRMFMVGVSIGVVTLDHSFDSVAEVLSGADSACYLAKEGGRNRVQVYCPDDRKIRSRSGEMHWVTRLAEALEHSRFTLYAQQIRPVSDASLEPSHEILLRMVERDGQLVLPSNFIPAAERYGLMPRLDRWVIERTIQELARLRDEGRYMPRLALNLSAASLEDEQLYLFIADLLRVHRVPPQRLSFELTETAAVAQCAAVGGLLNDLRALGCPIGLDDFGSGMSWFGYLRRLPVDYIKIDGSFVQRMNQDPVDRTMVASIHRIARVMGLRTVAEQVQSEAVLACLREIGIDYGQGCAIAAPVPLTELLQAQADLPADMGPATDEALQPVAPGIISTH